MTFKMMIAMMMTVTQLTLLLAVTATNSLVRVWNKFFRLEKCSVNSVVMLRFLG